MFGELLRHYRESAGLTQEALARQVPCDRSQVAKVEAAKRVPTDTFAKACDRVLGTGQKLFHLWERIDWYPEVQHPDWFERRAEMDAKATAIRAYQVQVVPGLLQTSAYAHALYTQRLRDAEEVEERVRARLSRQQRFLAPGGPTYIAVLDESCLQNLVGDATVMREQCAHLLEVGQLPNIRVQVVPFGQRGIDRPDTSMSLIQLPDGHQWVYSESLDSGHFSDDPALFTRHSQTYDVLRADCLSGHESAALISDMMERYGHHAEARSVSGNLDQEQLQRGQRRRLHRSRPRIPRPRPRT
ncbi:helix-turn-helix domain-containing protein [Streptomyces sp. SKN60]|uniref:helix-turn-helix domain-containing protein n=1 Tax=Streptomyces sp. SKN60 TaxID=2855506 RepID=UPI0022453255|nr:helix-turn-helix transcriptional regulator [Streptomyces sp. SKN60]MCX2179046.1 helix-turn-helix domain-containing protein [Streptomyces sp. SKN60]